MPKRESIRGICSICHESVETKVYNRWAHKECINIQNKAYQKTKAGKIARNEANKRYYKTTRGKDIAKSKKHRRRILISKSIDHFTADQWRNLVNKYDSKCVKCGVKTTKLEADHILPLVKGGSNSITNIQPLCKLCHKTKGTQTIDYRS